MEVFWLHGYEGASMAELTKAMGLNSPSIYAAWGSKRGLFDAVLAQYRSRRTARRDYVLAGATAREVAERMLFDTIDWLVDPNEPLGCFLIQSGLSAGVGNDDVPRASAAQRHRTREALTERFEKAKADGDLSPSADPGALAAYLHMIALGLAVQAQDGVIKEQLEESARRALTGWPA
ncbi:TetR/AcrR family transcriptional regulator [Bordetella genomosp. 8]|nr:TetR/AcrR family transcriptional regulator [Bordetella genomosp. 8]